MLAPPGTGSGVLSKRLPTILPRLSLAESLETTRIYSAADKLAAGQALLARRPARSPHHSASGPALVGGGTIPQAGQRLHKQALTEFGLSARAHDKILRVARTIADFAGTDSLHPDHVSEAIMYRRLDRRL